MSRPMNRELKFRARVSGTNVWISDFGFHFTDPEKIFLGESQLMKLSEGFAEEHGEFYDDLRYFDIDTMVQFTGLRDKSGKEIYEGDIVCWSGLEVYEVKWSNGYSYEGGPWVGYGHLDDRSKDWEIIGNIYENPDLLKQP